MTDIRDKIAAHRAWGDGVCECGFEFGEDASAWADHLMPIIEKYADDRYMDGYNEGAWGDNM